MMFWQPRRMTAHDLARDFVVTSQAFADTFIQYVAAEHIGESAALVLNRRMETCAVVWASILATFEASGLGTEEREKVIPLVRDGLVPYWRKYGADDFAFTSHVLERSSEYLRYLDPHSQLKTATGLMRQLLATIDPAAAELLPVRTLTALLAHRMISDLRRLNEIKSGHNID
jgi:hypothetical protein